MSGGDFLVISSGGVADFDPANADGELKHLSPHFDLVGVLVLVDLQDGDLPLGYEKDNRDRGLVAGQADTDVGGAGVEQKLPLFVHLEEEVAGLNKKPFLVGLVDLHIFLVVRDQFAALEVGVVPEFLSEFLEVDLVGGAGLDAGGVLHCDVGEGDVLVDEGQVAQLPLLVEVEHDLGLDLGEEVGVPLEAHVHVLVLLGGLLEVVVVVLLVLLQALPPVDVVLVVVELRVRPL